MKQWHKNAQLSAAGHLRQSLNIRNQDYPILLALILYNNLSGKDFGTTCRFKVAFLKGRLIMAREYDSFDQKLVYPCEFVQRSLSLSESLLRSELQVL